MARASCLRPLRLDGAVAVTAVCTDRRVHSGLSMRHDESACSCALRRCRLMTMLVAAGGQ